MGKGRIRKRERDRDRRGKKSDRCKRLKRKGYGEDGKFGRRKK